MKHGAKVNIAENLGETPLHIAAKYGACKTVRLLLANGAKVNAKDRDGKTPLIGGNRRSR